MQALASLSAGATASATPYPNQLWTDETSGWVKVRNLANTDWVLLFPLPASTSTILMIDNLAADPASGVLAAKTAPYLWYNTVDKKLKMWDGTKTVLMG